MLHCNIQPLPGLSCAGLTRQTVLTACDNSHQTLRFLNENTMPNIAIAAFYQFARLPRFKKLRQPLQDVCDAHGVRGILLLADEGVNGTLAGTPEAMQATMAAIRSITGLATLEQKNSFADTMPFLRMKVRLKSEIVTIGDKSVDPLQKVGTYVAPQDWNELISDPDVVVIDARNSFEFGVGTFHNAIDPRTKSFGEFPAFVRSQLDPARHKKIAMFCTGGIRCEKASSFMLDEGFEQVYHLKGGILKYLEEIPPEQSLWSGACFVFDGRVAVGHGLGVENFDLCFGCRAPLTTEDRQSEDYEQGVSCPHCSPLLTPAQRASARERQHQIKLAKDRGESHLGPRKVKAEAVQAGLGHEL